MSDKSHVLLLRFVNCPTLLLALQGLCREIAICFFRRWQVVRAVPLLDNNAPMTSDRMKSVLLSRASDKDSQAQELHGRACLLLVFAFLGLTGCATVQNPQETGATGQEALAAHVRFLSQPALKGRKTGTNGSRHARQYIEEHFRRFGLTPWEKARSYEWPFERGVNVVGFLPGTDPKLSKEVVLVSAHYDHLGKDKDGLHPGAADNASGVAALLETARRLATSRPKRSVLFVAFDCEEMMLFGSFAFTCEPAVQKAKIAAVVNVDMLGRNFFDVVRHTLFVVGTEGYPNTGEQVRGYGSAAGIRVLPLGSDLVGPRGDHVAFEALGVPCLFFSCGSFRDYHQPQDTANKLDYEDIERSTKVILETVEWLANPDELERAVDARNGYTNELQTIHTVMTEVKSHFDQAGIKKEDAEAFVRLDQEAERLLAENRLDEKSRRQLATDATGVLAPYLIPQTPGKKPPTAEQQDQLRLWMQCLQEFYSGNHAEVLEGYRKFVAQILKYRPGLVRGMPKFEHSIYDLSDNDISLSDIGQDRHSLNVLGSTWTMIAEIKWSKWVLKSFNASISLINEDLDCEGTREQLLDYCLMRWHAEQSNAVHVAALRRVFRRVTGDEPCEDFDTQFKQRLRSGGFNNAKDWLVHCIGSDCPQLQLQGLQAAMQTRDDDKRLSRAACGLLQRSSVRPDVRASAIDMAVHANSKESLLAICQLLGDSTQVYKREFVPMLQTNYPFNGRALVIATRQGMERWFKESPDASKTLGRLAREKLKEVAKKDLGDQEHRWRSWVEGRKQS